MNYPEKMRVIPVALVKLKTNAEPLFTRLRICMSRIVLSFRGVKEPCWDYKTHMKLFSLADWKSVNLVTFLQQMLQNSVKNDHKVSNLTERFKNSKIWVKMHQNYPQSFLCDRYVPNVYFTHWHHVNLRHCEGSDEDWNYAPMEQTASKYFLFVVNSSSNRMKLFTNIVLEQSRCNISTNPRVWKWSLMTPSVFDKNISCGDRWS